MAFLLTLVCCSVNVVDSIRQFHKFLDITLTARCTHKVFLVKETHRKLHLDRCMLLLNSSS